MLKAIGPNGQVSSSESAERLFREAMTHSDELLRYAWRLTRQRVDAEDLVQDTMLKAYVAFGQFQDGSSLKAWLYRIMINTWFDRHRSRQRRPAEQLSAEITDAQMMGHALRSHCGMSSPEAEVLKLVLERAGCALRSLPIDLRTIIYYADVAGYRNAEIAEILHIPVGTVASRLRRGRSRLRELLLDAPDRR